MPTAVWVLRDREQVGAIASARVFADFADALDAAANRFNEDGDPVRFVLWWRPSYDENTVVDMWHGEIRPRGRENVLDSDRFVIARKAVE